MVLQEIISRMQLLKDFPVCVSIPDNDSRPKIKVFVYNVQQLFLCLMGSSVSE